VTGVIGITLARMMKRRQFGRKLFEHQALRLRIADLAARVELLQHALQGMAAGGRPDLRAAVSVKVTAARLGEEVAGECMHIFGDSGFLIDETPIGRWLARHETRPGRRRHRRGPLGAGGGRTQTRLRQL
jgi:acyl-ACP dehydrogenase